MVYQWSGERAEPELDAVFGALAHVSRRSLIRQLLACESPMGVSELAATTGMSPQLLNKHATALERAGLVSRERVGRAKQVRVHPEALGPARLWIEETSAYWDAQLDALERYVETLRDRPRPDEEEEG